MLGAAEEVENGRREEEEEKERGGRERGDFSQYKSEMWLSLK